MQNSLSGFQFALRETAFRQELLLGLVHFAAIAIIRPSIAICIILMFAYLLVFVFELFNTAIEAVVDLVSPEYHELAKKAKDCASAAICCALLGVALSWCLVLVNIIV